MAEDREGPSAEDIAYASMAHSDLVRTQNYLQRGRQFEGLDDDALSAQWVGDMQAWSRCIRERPVTLDDADAEYKLRQLEAPYNLVAAEVEEIISATSKAHAAMSDEDRERANAHMLAEYEAHQRSRN